MYYYLLSNLLSTQRKLKKTENFREKKISLYTAIYFNKRINSFSFRGNSLFSYLRQFIGIY